MIVKPLLSIIIPTKDRYEYLIPLIQLIHSFESKAIELVIQDNSNENNRIVEFLETLNCDKTKYFHNSCHLSVIENCDLAVSNSTGHFVCFIGDDDGVLPMIVDCCLWMKRKNIDSVYFNKAKYIWPDLSGKYSFSNNSATLKFSTSSVVKKVCSKKELQKVLRLGGAKMLNLPRLYHGIVSRAVLEKVKDKTGSFFPGPSPDMANAVALSLCVKNFYYIGIPIIISGSGVKSTAGQGAKHEHKGRLESKLFLPSDTVQKWTKNIPKFWSGPTIWAESLLKSLSRSASSMCEEFNYPYLFANCLVFNPEFKEVIKKTIIVYCAQEKINIALLKIQIKTCILKIYYQRFRSLISNIYHKYYVNNNDFKNLKTINEAVKVLDHETSSYKIFFKTN